MATDLPTMPVPEQSRTPLSNENEGTHMRIESPEQPHTPIPNENESPYDRSAESSNPVSREGSRPPKRRKNVQFTPGGESLDTQNHRAAFDLQDDTNPPPRPKPLPRARSITPKLRRVSPASVGRKRSPERISERSEEKTGSPPIAPIPKIASGKVRPSIMRFPSSDSSLGNNTPQSDVQKGKQQEDDEAEEEADDDAVGKAYSQQTAQDRAQRLSRMMGNHSAPGSRYSSPHRRQRKKSAIRSPLDDSPESAPPSPPPDGQGGMPLDLTNIPLERLESKRTKYGIEDDTDEEDEEGHPEKPESKKMGRTNRFYRSTARLVNHHTGKKRPKLLKVRPEESPEAPSGTQTPVYERDPYHYVPKPKEYREGYLSSLLKLYNEQGAGTALAQIPGGHAAVTRAAHRRDSNNLPLMGSGVTSPGPTPGTTPGTTPGGTPRGSPTPSESNTPRLKHQKWYYKNPQQSQSTGALSDLVSSSTVFAQPGGSKQASALSKQPAAVRPKPKQKPLSSQATDALDTVLGKKKKNGHRNSDSIRIQVHIAETVQRQGYLLKICRSLMTYGAPTHRLEEYMRMSARVLEIDGQFLYIPGCMIVSFDDAATHTTEVKIVRTNQGVNLGKLRDVHEVYKEVVHDLIGVEEAMQRLDEINDRRDQYHRWVRVIVYGFASACVGPFAFGARPIDLPIAFLLGCLLGIMQLIIAPRSELYSNIFEISAAVLTSFLARAFGSISGGSVFCFSALAQSSIALILPGYTVLCGSLELQSRNIVAGSVRMVYAIIYSLFLGFGITIGTSFYGGIDKNAASKTTCNTTMPFWFELIFVPPFTLCLIIINQGKWKQMPIMLGIAFVGYIVNHFSAIRFASNAQIANTLGALAIGVLGNLYSRLRHGLAAAALLPAIFVQVPSGLAAGGSLVSGVTSANQITKRPDAGNGTTTISNPGSVASGLDVNSMVFNVAYSMIQVAIGITVGLFLSALIVYPFGKRRSGLFSF